MRCPNDVPSVPHTVLSIANPGQCYCAEDLKGKGKYIGVVWEDNTEPEGPKELDRRTITQHVASLEMCESRASCAHPHLLPVGAPRACASARSVMQRASTCKASVKAGRSPGVLHAVSTGPRQPYTCSVHATTSGWAQAVNDRRAQPQVSSDSP